MKIYSVVYGNYFPRELDGIYDSREKAEKRVEELNVNGNTMWRVEESETNQ